MPDFELEKWRRFVYATWRADNPEATRPQKIARYVVVYEMNLAELREEAERLRLARTKAAYPPKERNTPCVTL